MLKEDHVHIEHLIAGLYQSKDDRVLDAFSTARIDWPMLLQILHEKNSKIPTDPESIRFESGEATALPPLSGNAQPVVEQLAVFQAQSEKSDAILPHHLLYSALSIGTSVTSALQKRGLWRELLKKETAPPPVTGVLADLLKGREFSPRATEVIERAKSLAWTPPDSKLPQVSSSAFLFGLAVGKFSPWQHGCVSRPNYQTVFRQWLGTRSIHKPDSSERYTATPSFQALIEGAQDVAVRVSGVTSRRICFRHLLAALLLASRSESPPVAIQRMADIGVDVPAVIQALLDYVLTVEQEKPSTWRNVFSLTAADNATRLTAYTSDSSSGEADLLEIDQDVNAFAALIASVAAAPPISIGLFGDWGSGKTFFMRRLKRRVETLSLAAWKSDKLQREVSFYKRIVQIEFNAWHYAEGNLWASLVEHIFANLRISPDEKAEAADALQKHLIDNLHLKQLAEQQANAKKDEAEKALAAATQELEDLKSRHEEEAKNLQQLSGRDLLEAALADPATRTLVNAALRELGSDAAGHSAQEMFAALGAARATLQRGNILIHSLLRGSKNERSKRLAWLIAAIALPAAIAIGIAVLMSSLGSDGIAQISAIVTGAAGLLATGATWVRAHAGKVTGWIERTEEAQRRVETVLTRKQGENAGQIAEAEKKLDLLRDQVIAAQLEKQQAEQNLAEAVTAQKKASVGWLLADFIQDRAQSEDYRKHLGLLALVRRDFEKLSDLIDRANKDLCAPDSEREKPFDLVQEKEDASTRVNRIVLYIDDLDRCPAHKVIQVLQAVHLLLAFPLFVVVVGVDRRWVSSSLRSRYRELLGGKSRNGRENPLGTTLEESATPDDYLEKIFQIPFWLHPLGKEGCERMIAGLFKPTAKAPDSKTSPSTGPTSPVVPSSAENGKTGDAPGGSPAGPVNPAPATGSATTVPSPFPAATAPAKPPEENLHPESLEIYAVEVAFAHRLAPLLGRSPRALKRFFNVYRLLKASLPESEQPAFLDDRSDTAEFRAVMFLLALISGKPSLWPIFRNVLETKQRARNLADILPALTPRMKDQRAWPPVRKWLCSSPNPGIAAVHCRDWLTRVSRFSFHPGGDEITSIIPGRKEGTIKKRPSRASTGSRTAK
jgi:hypothetical protein